MRFQRKNWEAGQSVVGLESLKVAPERAIHEAVKVKSKQECRPKELRNASNMDR